MKSSNKSLFIKLVIAGVLIPVVMLIFSAFSGREFRNPTKDIEATYGGEAESWAKLKLDRESLVLANVDFNLGPGAGYFRLIDRAPENSLHRYDFHFRATPDLTKIEVFRIVFTEGYLTRETWSGREVFKNDRMERGE